MRVIDGINTKTRYWDIEVARCWRELEKNYKGIIENFLNKSKLIGSELHNDDSNVSIRTVRSKEEIRLRLRTCEK